MTEIKMIQRQAAVAQRRQDAKGAYELSLRPRAVASLRFYPVSS